VQDVGPSSAPDPRPAIELCRALAEARSGGADFETAWRTSRAHALAGLAKDERRSWAAAFLRTRSAWRRGYERERVARFPLVGIDGVG
jgi:hypothetical protein